MSDDIQALNDLQRAQAKKYAQRLFIYYFPKERSFRSDRTSSDFLKGVLAVLDSREIKLPIQDINNMLVQLILDEAPSLQYDNFKEYQDVSTRLFFFRNDLIDEIIRIQHPENREVQPRDTEGRILPGKWGPK